ncbi:MAG: phosphoesterase, PA-phosphatase related protein [Gammaproteobacteria bacterium]|jgi:membrane-associated phospholipid phosphatase|nr:phosphoesterase, PA-phosphatase related protein [Gammaproteobacteria bacterium]
MLKAPVRYLATSLPIVLLAIIISYFFIDRALSVWVYQFGFHQSKGMLSSDVDLIVTQLVYCALLPIFLLYFYYHMQGVNSRLVRCLGLLSGSVSVAFFIKTSLQFLFGRYAPRYFDSHVLMFVSDPARYGFHWLHGGGFPSGHMCVFSAALTSIVLYYPVYRWLAVGLLAILGACLIAANYHFLSDVIAGAYLGVSITLAIHYLQKSPSIPL